MKKLLSILLILALTLSLAFAMTACGDDDGSTDNDSAGSGAPSEDNGGCKHEYVDSVCRHCGAAEPYYDPDGWTKPEK